jgi:hypothetical protein
MASADPRGSQGWDRGRTPPDGSDAADGFWPVGRALLGTLRHPAIPVIMIFLLAGVFDLLSGDRVVDGVILFAVAVGLGWDAIRRPLAVRATADDGGAGKDLRGRPLRKVAQPAASWRRRAYLRLSPVVVVGGLVYAVLVAGLARYSWPATIAVGVPAATGVAIAWRRPVGEPACPRRIAPAGAVAWAMVLVALALWELSALLLQPSLTTDSWAHPTISVLMDPILATHLGRSIVLSLWLTSGWLLQR